MNFSWVFGKNVGLIQRFKKARNPCPFSKGRVVDSFDNKLHEYDYFKVIERKKRMSLTEAYIISIPETFLVIAISILIINGLVGIEKKAWVQNPLAPKEESPEASILRISKRKLDKSVFSLGILTLALSTILLSNIDIHYVGKFIFDDFSKTIKIVILIGSAIILLIGFGTMKNLAFARQHISKDPARSTLINILEPNLELVILMILGVVGILVVISSYDLLSLYVGIELQSFTLYVLAAYKRSSEFSTEAGLKYFILGAIASGFLLFGSSIIYGVTGSIQLEEIAKVLLLKDQTVVIGLLFVFAGLFFKSSIAPFHQWTPDVYEGAPTLVTLFFASVPKLAIFSIIVRILSLIGVDSIHQVTNFSIINNIVMFCAIFSMAVGAITGLYQQKIKRLLAYSTILNMGFALIGLISFSIDGLQSLFFYLFIYLFTNIGVFTILLATKEIRNGQLHSLVYITDLQKLRNQPLLAFSFAMIISSFAGFPPLAGFFAKLYVFFSAVAFQYYFLLFVAVIMSVISCFYYLRLIKYVYFAPVQSNVFIQPISSIHSIILSVVVLGLIAFIFYPGPLLTLSLSLALDVLA